jgi:hypothetical protein
MRIKTRFLAIIGVTDYSENMVRTFDVVEVKL